MIHKLAQFFIVAQVKAVEVLQAGEEAVGAFHLPLNLEWTMTLHLDVIIEGLVVRRLILQTLVLGEFVAEAHRQIVQLPFLVENHFQSEFVDFSVGVQQVYRLFFLLLFCIVKDYGC